MKNKRMYSRLTRKQKERFYGWLENIDSFSLDWLESNIQSEKRRRLV